MSYAIQQQQVPCRTLSVPGRRENLLGKNPLFLLASSFLEAKNVLKTPFLFMQYTGKLKTIVCLFLTISSFLEADAIIDHLNTEFEHVGSVKIEGIDAAFLIRLQENENLENLKTEFSEKGIPLNEYNKFNKIPPKVMAQFCSSIISPYLLTQLLSHLSIYKYCLEKGIEKALILENLAYLVDDPVKLESIVRKLDRSLLWDMIYTDVDYHDPDTGKWNVPNLPNFSTNRSEIDRDISRVFCRYGTTAYVISASGMRKILEYFSNQWDNLPYDQVLFKISSLNKYGVNSDIITNRYSTNPQSRGAGGVSTRPCYQRDSEFWLTPNELLTFNRFDIMAKYIYAKYFINQYKTKWHENLYRAHLEKWTQCYDTFPLKMGFQEFQLTFNWLIQNIRVNSFDKSYPIPINPFGFAYDGAHRIGASLALGIPVKVKVESRTSSPHMSAAVFRAQCHLDEKYLDHMAYEYTKLKTNTLIVSLFPSGYKHREEVESILAKYGIVIYHKDIFPSESGTLEWIRLVYNGEWWTGSYLDDFKHTRSKAALCFPKELLNEFPLRVYLYECENPQTARTAKEEIRNLCQYGNESVHINDTHEQTKIIAATIFNQNSIDFLNKKRLNIHERFDFLLENLKRFIADHHIDPETISVDTGGVLAAYGLRDCNDLDIIHRNPLCSSFQNYEIDSHNRHLHHHSLPLDELLFNPENHFYYNGIKFVKIDLVKKMKLDRGSEKDFSDIDLMNELIKCF